MKDPRASSALRQALDPSPGCLDNSAVWSWQKRTKFIGDLLNQILDPPLGRMRLNYVHLISSALPVSVKTDNAEVAFSIFAFLNICVQRHCHPRPPHAFQLLCAKHFSSNCRWRHNLPSAALWK